MHCALNCYSPACSVLSSGGGGWLCVCVWGGGGGGGGEEASPQKAQASDFVIFAPQLHDIFLAQKHH